MRPTDHLTNWELIASIAKTLGHPVEFRWRRFCEAYRRYNRTDPEPDAKHGHGVGKGRHAKDTNPGATR